MVGRALNTAGRSALAYFNLVGEILVRLMEMVDNV